jgi:hypothetical protein
MKSDIFEQDSAQTLKDGSTVTCVIMPREEIVAIAWKINNPGNKSITISPEDISFYSADRKFRLISAQQAFDAVFNWTDSASTNRQEIREDLQGSPGEASKEGMVVKSAFKFGESSESAIYGVTYFACRLKNLDSVTAEIKVGEDVLKFPFDGGGP